MPQFQDHVHQASRNLKFLEHVSNNCPNHIDWQVTSCFYVAVHLVNAHLAQHGMQYRKHVDVNHALNPFATSSVSNGSALSEADYLAYKKLQGLSRRSRYLVNDKENAAFSDKAFLTHDVHFVKAIRHLNPLMYFFDTKYDLKLQPINIVCNSIKKGELSFFHVT